MRRSVRLRLAQEDVGGPAPGDWASKPQENQGLAPVVEGTRPRPSLLGPVYASTTLSMFGYTLISVSLPFRFQSLGLSVVQYGTVVALFALGMLLTEGLFGVLAYRIANRRWIVLLGATVAALMVVVGLSTSFLEIAVGYGLLGTVLIYPVPLARWLALVSGGPGTGGSGTGRYAVFFGIGTVAGSTVGPLLFASVGFEVLVTVAIVVWTAGVALLASPPWHRTGIGARGRPDRGRVRRLFTPHFAFLALVVTLYFTCFSLTTNFLQYYSVALFGGTTADAGYVIGVARATTLVAGFGFGVVVDRWGPPKSAPFGFLLLIAGALATLVSQTYLEMVLATLLFATGCGWLTADLLPVALGPVPDELQGTAVGVFGSFEDLGLLIGPATIGAIYAGFGARAIFPFVALVALIGAVCALALRWRTGPSAARSTSGSSGREAEAAPAPPLGSK